jgi:ribose/xylose/arabinose/galactoside ABC-type transport system permease subunit
MGDTSATLAAQKRGLKLSTTLILLGAFAILFVIFSVVSSDFYSTFNILSMVTNITFYGLTAIGFCLNLVAGEVDISIGANIALTSCVTAYAYDAGLPIGVAIASGLLSGLTMGVVNALVITIFRVNSLIVTLGTMSIAQGVAYTLTRGQSILIMEDVLGFFGRGTVGPIPFPIIVLAIFVLLFSILLNGTKFGRQVKAVGSNANVAYLSGIKVRQVKFITITLCAGMASVAGLLVASLSAVGMPQHGIGQEFPIISAVILGGASLKGGKGSIVGSIIGVLIMGVIYNGLVMLNNPSYTVEMIRGLILILIVASYEMRAGKRR